MATRTGTGTGGDLGAMRAHLRGQWSAVAPGWGRTPTISMRAARMWPSG